MYVTPSRHKRKMSTGGDVRYRTRNLETIEEGVVFHAPRTGTVRPLKWPVETVKGWSTTVKIGLSVLFVAVLVTAITCGIDPAHLIRPLPAPVASETYTYVSSSTFVFAAVGGTEETLLALKWDGAGTVYTDGGGVYETVSACADPSCSMLIRKLANTSVDVVIKYPGLRIHDVYMNSSQVVVLGSGFIGNGWDLPDSVTTAATNIQYEHLGYMLIAIVYDRTTLTYMSSSLIIPGDQPISQPEFPTDVQFMVGRGAMTDVALGVALSGTCTGSWAVTPQVVDHTTSADDRTLSCGATDTITALVVVWSDLVPRAVWHADTLNTDPTLAALTVNVQLSSTEIAVYGSHTSESGTFSIPFFIEGPVPGVLPSGMSPPAVLDVAWVFGDGISTAAYVTRWNLELLTLTAFLPMEVISANMYVKYRDGYVDVVSEASLLSSFTVYDFHADTVTPVGPFTDPSTDAVSPISCSWATTSGALHSCVLMSGTADVRPAWFPGTGKASVSTVVTNGNVLVPSWLHPDNGPDFTYPATGVAFTGISAEVYASKGVVFNVNADAQCAHPEITMIPNGATHGTYHYDGLGAVWYADVRGVTSFVCI